MIKLIFYLLSTLTEDGDTVLDLRQGLAMKRVKKGKEYQSGVSVTHKENRKFFDLKIKLLLNNRMLNFKHLNT